jgi:hypothetical protein
MTVWVIREGKLVEKGSMQEARDDRRSIFPAPMVSRMESFESPVTGKEISSWRQRDRDMAAVDAIDRRDLPKDHKFSKGREAQYNDPGRSRPAEWGGLD